MSEEVIEINAETLKPLLKMDRETRMEYFAIQTSREFIEFLERKGLIPNTKGKKIRVILYKDIPRDYR